MRLMPVLFSILMLTSSSAFAQEARVPAHCQRPSGMILEVCYDALGVTAPFAEFSRQMDEARKLLGSVERTRVVVWQYRDHGSPTDVWTLEVLSVRDSPRFVTYVTLDFLGFQNHQMEFEHVALHEMCHVKLGHVRIGHVSRSPSFEVEAERCVYRAVGDEKYFAFWEARKDPQFTPEVKAQMRKEFSSAAVQGAQVRGAPTATFTPILIPENAPAAVQDLVRGLNKSFREFPPTPQPRK